MDNEEQRLNMLKFAFERNSDGFKDFSLETIVSSSFLPIEDRNYIMSEKCEEKQAFLLLHLLLERRTPLKQFLKELQQQGHYINYNWLASRIHNDYKELISINATNRRIDLIQELELYKHTLLDLKDLIPKFSNFNIFRINYFYEIRKHLLRLQSRDNLVLYGELGYGKKWLAMNACCDYEVLKAMNFNIFWIDVGQCNSVEADMDTLQKLWSQVRKKLNIRELETANNIYELLRVNFAQDELKKSLLVLVNVMNKMTLKAFNFPCKKLIITRNKSIAESLPFEITQTVWILKGFSERESFNLFEKILLRKLSPEKQLSAQRIFQKCHGHPFLLTTIAQNIKNSNSWDIWLNILNEEMSVDNKILNSIEQSLTVLNEREKSFYNRLSVFYCGAEIPVTILPAYWDLAQNFVNDMINKFDKFSLLSIKIDNQDCKMFSLHFLYTKYLKEYNKHIMQDLHKDIIEAYKVETNLENRKELYVFNFPNDNYFYTYIGYHLKEANRLDLLWKLYFDFGFLEHKLRKAGLPNTVGDLKYFLKDIPGYNKDKKRIIADLIQFLPNIEEMIYQTEDTSLLQYALNTNSSLRAIAEEQALQFPSRLWFTHSDHSHRNIQMIRLNKNPVTVTFINPDTCLIALEDKNILLADLSCDYNEKPINFVGNRARIVRMEIFLENYIVSLDKSNNLKLWSMKQQLLEHTKSKLRKRKTRKYESYISAGSFDREGNVSRTFLSTQVVEEKCIAFYFTNKDQVTALQLHVATPKKISIFEWNSELERFDQHSSSPVPKIEEIRNILPINSCCYDPCIHYSLLMVVNSAGKLFFLSIRDTSIIELTRPWPYRDIPINIYHFKNVVIFVYEKTVVRMTLEIDTVASYQHQTIYTGKHNITCSALSEDNKVLVIGTRQGFKVLDPEKSDIILKDNNSYWITCVDICPIHDMLYKYIVIYGSKDQPKVNVFALKDVDEKSQQNHWDTNGNTNKIPMLRDIQTFELVPNETGNGKLSIIAINSTGDAYLIENNVLKNPYLHKFGSKATQLTVINNNEYIVGCKDGNVYRCKGNKASQLFKLPECVEYLQFTKSEFIVASCFEKTVVYNKSKSTFKSFEMGVVKHYVLADKYLIFIDGNCIILLLEAFENNFRMLDPFALDECFESSDFNQNLLIIATKQKNIYIWQFNTKKLIKYGASSEYNDLKKYIKKVVGGIVTCVTISQDNNYCALGLQSGDIEIHKIFNGPTFLYRLESHKSPIKNMKFSNFDDYNLPIILVSLSEQMCFWNISYILNNPNGDEFSRSKIRTSSRFSSRYQDNTDGDTTDSEAGSLQYESHFNMCSENVWSRKRGLYAKPELLSCINLQGTIANKFYTNKDFTQFVTIDNEDEFYFLEVKDKTATNTAAIDNSSSSVI